MIFMRSDEGAKGQASARVARALEIHRSVVACHEHIARGSCVHSLTAALMLPCYKAEFRTLALAMTSEEERELRYALDSICEPAA